MNTTTTTKTKSATKQSARKLARQLARELRELAALSRAPGGKITSLPQHLDGMRAVALEIERLSR